MCKSMARARWARLLDFSAESCFSWTAVDGAGGGVSLQQRMAARVCAGKVGMIHGITAPSLCWVTGV